MRLEEISQLSVDDVYFVDGIWVFDVNANPSRDGRNDKQVKNRMQLGLFLCIIN